MSGTQRRKPYRDWTPEQKESHRQRTLRWRELNREKYLAQGRGNAHRWREKNPELHKEAVRRFREKHPEYWRTANDKEKGRIAAKKWAAKNGDRIRLAGKRQKLKKYGLTLEGFDQMLLRQSNSCAICSETLGKKSHDTHIDHCHSTGRVRAILCNHCNNVIGRARENPAILRLAAAYLERWGCS